MPLTQLASGRPLKFAIAGLMRRFRDDHKG
jgi:hypothetical protein